jgi:hypothetical protein
MQCSEPGHRASAFAWLAAGQAGRDPRVPRAGR